MLSDNLLINKYAYAGLYPNNAKSILFGAKPKTSVDTIDIRSTGIYPANKLSNFASTNFIFDGVRIKSMEGFLQSLKVKDTEMQKKICAMTGPEAKAYSKSIHRNRDEIILHWDGKTFTKSSDEYRKLLKEILVEKDNIDQHGFFQFGRHKIKSVDGFLRALKTDNPIMQKMFCEMPSDSAKNNAKYIKVQYAPRTLYWNGKEYKRDSEEYQELLQRVFSAKFEADVTFRTALKSTKGKKLTHSLGSKDISSTILTEAEFINILDNLINRIN